MPNVKLGNKHSCSCGVKYYDLEKPDPVCPKCGSRPENKVPGASRKRRKSDKDDLDDNSVPDPGHTDDDDAGDGDDDLDLGDDDDLDE